MKTLKVNPTTSRFLLKTIVTFDFLHEAQPYKERLCSSLINTLYLVCLLVQKSSVKESCGFIDGYGAECFSGRCSHSLSCPHCEVARQPEETLLSQLAAGCGLIQYRHESAITLLILLSERRQQ